MLSPHAAVEPPIHCFIHRLCARYKLFYFMIMIIMATNRPNLHCNDQLLPLPRSTNERTRMVTINKVTLNDLMSCSRRRPRVHISHQLYAKLRQVKSCKTVWGRPVPTAHGTPSYLPPHRLSTPLISRALPLKPFSLSPPLIYELDIGVGAGGQGDRSPTFSTGG